MRRFGDNHKRKTPFVLLDPNGKSLYVVSRFDLIAMAVLGIVIGLGLGETF